MDAAATRRHRLALGLLCATAVACALAASSLGAPRKVAPGPWCGGTLWHLMTLSDADRKLVDLKRTPYAISDIADQKPPAKIGLRRTTDFQRHVWRLAVVVDRYRIASNGEIVLILYSIPTAQYMNAYLENPNCLSSKSRDRTGMIAARREFTSHCGRATAAWQLLGASVDIGGVGYWNPSRVTRGALPNGAELRPVTNLKIVSGCGVASG